MDLQRWNTLLTLKENHKSLGLKGWIFFIVDFPKNIKTNNLEYVIAQPTFTGMGVGVGIFTFILTKEEIEQYFKVSTKTFQEYAKELEEDYFNNVEE